MSQCHRSKIVKLFRSLADGKSDRWSDAIDEATNKIGIMTSQDCHSILISLNKAIKSNHRIHPVRVACLANHLTNQILKSPDSSLRTKAGTLGLLTRIGIDWKSHLPKDMRDPTILQFSESFKAIAPGIESEPIDVQSLGYLCDAAVYFDMYSPEFTHIIEQRVLKDYSHFPVLAIVQIAQYLARYPSTRKDVWRNIVDRILFDADNFTPQNFDKVLSGLVRVEFTSSVLVERVAEILSKRTDQMRLSDCVSIANSVSLLSTDDMDMKKFAKAIQRRSLVLLVTSPVRVSVGEIQKLSESMRRLMISPSKPFMFLTGRNSFIHSISP